MKAWVWIANFGDEGQKKDLCEKINELSMFHAYINDEDVPVIPCKVSELGKLLTIFAKSSATNWIEYTIQFEV
jgi:hypothetical protein